MAYGDDLGFAAYLSQFGYTLPDDAPSSAVLRARGSIYLDSTYEGLWCGQRTGGVMQADGWPRTGAKVGCTTPIADDVIPPAVVNAAYRAAWLEAEAPGRLAGSVSSGGRIRRQRVEGAVEREFFDDGKAEAGSGGPAFIDAEIDGAMRAFICANEGMGFLFQSIGT